MLEAAIVVCDYEYYEFAYIWELPSAGNPNRPTLSNILIMHSNPSFLAFVLRSG